MFRSACQPHSVVLSKWSVHHQHVWGICASWEPIGVPLAVFKGVWRLVVPRRLFLSPINPTLKVDMGKMTYLVFPYIDGWCLEWYDWWRFIVEPMARFKRSVYRWCGQLRPVKVCDQYRVCLWPCAWPLGHIWRRRWLVGVGRRYLEIASWVNFRWWLSSTWLPNWHCMAFDTSRC